MKSFEEQIESLAEKFPYPPTPSFQISTKPKLLSSRWQARIAVVFIIIVAILFIPTARATVSELVRIGIAYILQVDTPPSSKPRPQQLTDFTGEISLEQALAKFPYPIKLPSNYETAHYIFYQREANVERLIFIWTKSEQPQDIWLSLMILGPKTYILKQIYDEPWEMVWINTLPGLWIEAPHLLTLDPALTPNVFTIPHNVLLWEDIGLTYRLETLLEKDAAIQLAASFQPASNIISD